MASLPRRPSKAKTEMAGQHDFPVLFTIEGSNRHESMSKLQREKMTGSRGDLVILINAGHDIDEIRTLMEKSTSSPNCQEFMAKHRGKDITEKVGEISVKWSSEGRDRQLFPKASVLTEEASQIVTGTNVPRRKVADACVRYMQNCEAVLRLMAISSSKDVFDVKLERSKAPEKK